MDKQKIIEEMVKDMFDYARTLVDIKTATEDCRFVDTYKGSIRGYAMYLLNKGYRKIPENAVVINKDENPCLSCPVPEDIQRNVDCSTICGAVRLGIDWQNQCKVLVKENKQLTKALAEKGKETAEKFAERIKGLFNKEKSYTVADNQKVHEAVDMICKEITEGGGQ